MMFNRLPMILAASLLAGASASAQPAPGRLRAGAAKVDITPQQSELAVSTDVIRDHLFVRAIVVDDGATCAALVGMDQSGVPDQLYNDVVARVSASTKCPAENIIISATHTHSGAASGNPASGAPVGLVDAVVKAIEAAKAKLAPARVGYGTAKVDLNVNRDLFNARQEWRQQPNPDGPSDKTLAVVEFIGDDHVPIGVYMNYAMHPINFYLTGVLSADYPGEACRYVEELFDNKTVAIFSQSASGNQNPMFGARALGRVRSGRGPFIETIGAPPAPQQAGPATGFNPSVATSSRKPIPPENLEAYKKAIVQTGNNVVMMGTLIGVNAVRLMRDVIQPVDTARIWGAQQKFTCPGRDRLDAANPARENVFPGYKDGAEVNLKMNLLRIGDINFATVNGEVYSEIAMRLKAAAPASKTIVVTIANGRANSGYIYSDDAYSHLTFQVIGSRLKPGCAEGKIISTAVDLMHRSGE